MSSHSQGKFVIWRQRWRKIWQSLYSFHYPQRQTANVKANLTSLNKLLSTNVLAFHFKEGDFWSSYADIFILSCGIAVLQNQALCGIYKLSGNFNTVCDFLTLFYAVFLIILRGFAVFVPPPPPLPSSLRLNLTSSTCWDTSVMIHFKLAGIKLESSEAYLLKLKKNLS